MNALPIVRRELLVYARQPKTYRDRWLAGAAFIFLAGVVLASGGRLMAPQILNVWLFNTLVLTCYLVNAVSGPIFTADALSSEKREGTLGLLFLTDLRGHDIVLGKLTARGLNFGFQVTAVLPLIAVTLLSGGITGSQYLQAALALLNTAFYSLSAGLLVSAFSQSARKAAVGTVLLLVGFMAILPAMAAQEGYEWLETPAGLLSPTGTIAMAVGVSAGAGTFWESLLCTHACAWLWLISASLKLPQAWREGTTASRRLVSAAKLEEWSLGTRGARASHRARLLARNPVLWLGDRQRLAKTAIWTSLLIIVAFWLLNSSLEPYFWFNTVAVATTFGVVGWIFKIWMTSQAVQQTFEDRQSGALELMLTTPMKEREIIAGRMEALNRQFGLVCVLVGVGFALLGWASYRVMNIEWRQAPRGRADWEWAFHVAATLGPLFFLALDYWALRWVGLERALLGKGIVQATMQACMRVLILPWVVAVAAYLLFVLTTNSGQDALGLAVSIAVGCEVLFGLKASERVRKNLRAIVAGEVARR